ncbi:MAG: hypothetical protein QNJ29_05945 [Rhizobiaceae bacterium]|nr:hypothetical protein [Rhizobiaceae bacterium]
MDIGSYDPLLSKLPNTTEYQPARIFKLPLSDLNEHDQKVVWECVRSAVLGPFYPDWEFQTLFGFERVEIQAILDSWQSIDDADEDVHAVISKSMNLLLIYPIDESDRWGEFISVSQEQVARIFADWRGGEPTSPLDGMY